MSDMSLDFRVEYGTSIIVVYVGFLKGKWEIKGCYSIPNKEKKVSGLI